MDLALLPVLDLNTISSNEESIKNNDDLINLSSVEIADQIIGSLLSGYTNSLEFAVKRKLIVDAFELVMKHPQVKSLMMDEVQKFGKQGASALGANVSIFSRVQYKYDQDPTWRSLKEAIKPFEETIKAQEEKIKACCKIGHSITNDEDIVIATCVPAPRTESIAVSFSKK